MGLFNQQWAWHGLFNEAVPKADGTPHRVTVCCKRTKFFAPTGVPCAGAMFKTEVYLDGVKIQENGIDYQFLEFAGRRAPPYGVYHYRLQETKRPLWLAWILYDSGPAVTFWWQHKPRLYMWISSTDPSKWTSATGPTEWRGTYHNGCPDWCRDEDDDEDVDLYAEDVVWQVETWIA